VTRRLVALAALLLAVAWGAWIRAHAALADPSFDARDPRGLLRSDPALLYYFTERILESGGTLPADFRAEPRIQHPFVTDVPSEFPLGLEFLVAWTQRALGGDGPLHVTALWVSSACAALFVLGVFASVRAVTGSDAWAGLASGLALLTPGNYRTLAFLLVGEDLALPLFALHLGWLALALRTRRARDYLASGVLAAGALSTWHASSFVVTLELAVPWLWACLRGRSPFEERRAWLVLAPPAVAGLAVPVLRASGLLLSSAAALALSLFALAAVRRRHALGPRAARGLLVGVLALGLLAGRALAPTAYAHVHQVVWAKLRFLGRFPADPLELSFDARLLWQGPFETLTLADFLAWSGWPLVLLFALALLTLGLLRGSAPYERFHLGLALVSLPVGWMFARLAVLFALLAPVSSALALARWRRRGLALALYGVLGLAQACLFAGFVSEFRSAWVLPPRARAELVALIEHVRADVPPEEPIAGDFVNSTALLAHARRPIVLQPKYETDRSRRAAEAFLTTFFHGSSADLARLLGERFRCRWLLVDRHVLWDLSRVTAGLRREEREPRPGTAAAELLSDSQAVLEALPLFELRYRSPPGIPGADYRLFRLR
jgi:hypothetical protein